MNRIAATQLDTTSRATLQEAIALADRFFAARRPSMRLTLGQGGSITLALNGGTLGRTGADGLDEPRRSQRMGRSLPIRLVGGGFLGPRWGFDALTWGCTVRFRPVTKGPHLPSLTPGAQNSLFLYQKGGARKPIHSVAALLVHEMVHVEQEHRAPLGLAGYLVSYLVSWVLGGFRYRAISYEKAARSVAEEARRYFAETFLKEEDRFAG